MSKENAEKFFETLKADKAFAEEMQNALKAQKFETEEQAQKAVIDFAGSKGFSFTAAEVSELKKEAAELSDSDLDQVNAAGFFEEAMQAAKEYCESHGIDWPLSK